MEAKRDDFEEGAAQCVAALVAVRTYNESPTLLGGAVTNGTLWQFLDLHANKVYRDDQLYNVLAADLPLILGVLAFFCTRPPATETMDAQPAA